jgi:hypothetical protein
MREDDKPVPGRPKKWTHRVLYDLGFWAVATFGAFVTFNHTIQAMRRYKRARDRGE